MNWFETTLVAPGITRIREPHVHDFFRANLYRIEGRDFDVQFDFGTGIRPLTDVSPASGKPVLAIASHAHVDHVGSFHLYDRRAGHRLEAHTFTEMDDAGTLASWFVAIDGATSKQPGPGWAITDYALLPAPLSEFLDEGDVVDLGNRRLTVLHLPGHSPGSIALFDEMNGDFFSADAIYRGTLVDDIPGADVAVYLETMRRLSSLEVGTAYPGHGEIITSEDVRRIAESYVELKSSQLKA